MAVVENHEKASLGQERTGSPFPSGIAKVALEPASGDKSGPVTILSRKGADAKGDAAPAILSGPAITRLLEGAQPEPGGQQGDSGSGNTGGTPSTGDPAGA